MCNSNENQIVDLDFSLINDEFNWINNTVNPIQTVGGKLILKPVSALSEFKRGLGALAPANNRIRVKSNLNVFRPQTSTDETMCFSIGVFIGSDIIDEFNVYVDQLVAGADKEFNFDRVYKYESLSGNISLKIKTTEGFQNHIKLDYLSVNDFNFCDDNIRSYFVFDGLFEESKVSTSSAIRLKEYKIDGVETLTNDFFLDNASPGGVPINDWKFAKSNIDGSNRVSDVITPNSFNPFASEFGLTFDTVGSFHGGKPTGTINGNDYGPGVLNIGFDKPEILNDELIPKKGAFFFDVDFTKDLKIVFDVAINNTQVNPFNQPTSYRRYTIEFKLGQCDLSYTYVDLLRPENGVTDIFEDGFLSGITGTEIVSNEINCDDSFSFEGQTGVFEIPINLGPNLGLTGISFQAFAAPDKFEIEWNGQTFSSGYVGDSSFDNALLNLGISPSEINTFPGGNGIGILNFNKTSIEPQIAIVRVTAPISPTKWTFSGICPSGNPNIGTVLSIGQGDCLNPPTVWNDKYISNIDPFSFEPNNGDVIFDEQALITPFDGGGNTFRIRRMIFPAFVTLPFQFDISSNGVVSNVTQCSAINQPLTIVGSSESNCASCWSVLVDVPQGESRTVNFVSNFAAGGVYGVAQCPGPNQVTADFQETITASKTYTIGIDGSTHLTLPPGLSEITMTVMDGPTQIGQLNLNRSHANLNC